MRGEAAGKTCIEAVLREEKKESEEEGRGYLYASSHGEIESVDDA